MRGTITLPVEIATTKSLSREFASSELSEYQLAAHLSALFLPPLNILRIQQTASFTPRKKTAEKMFRDRSRKFRRRRVCKSLTGEIGQRRVQLQHVRVKIFRDQTLAHVAVGSRKPVHTLASPRVEIAKAPPAAELVLCVTTGCGGRKRDIESDSIVHCDTQFRSNDNVFCNASHLLLRCSVRASSCPKSLELLSFKASTLKACGREYSMARIVGYTALREPAV